MFRRSKGGLTAFPMGVGHSWKERFFPLLQRRASIFSSHRRNSRGYHVARVLNRSETKQKKTAERPTTRRAGPTRRFQYQFWWFFWRRLWLSSCQKHPAAYCLLFHKQMGHRHMFMVKANSRRRPMWRSVRRERETILSLLPLVVTDCRRPGQANEADVDASPTGFGIVSRDCSPNQLARCRPAKREDALSWPVSQVLNPPTRSCPIFERSVASVPERSCQSSRSSQKSPRSHLAEAPWEGPSRRRRRRT